MMRAARWGAVIVSVLAASLVLTKVWYLYPGTVPGAYVSATQFIISHTTLDGEDALDAELNCALAFALLTVSTLTAAGWYVLKKLRAGRSA